MKRKIIKIDPELCNGCGACASACHEGAIQMVGGKARLTREDYCDGLGDCLPACPTGAITFEEREAPAYDHAAVLAAKAARSAGVPPCGCPGSQSRALRRDGAPAPAGEMPSQLRQWPVQIKLAPVNAPYFDGCDLLIAVGVRFSDRALGNAATFAAQAKVLHIDIDRAEINKNVSTTLHITGDARVVLDLLLPRVEQKDNTQWMQQARSMMEEYLSDELFEPRKILRQMAAIAPEITVATDVGQHQMWTAQHFPFLHPRQLITSGGLGTMGFGLGAAMGAAASDPQGKPVALITGDGSFRMNLTELSTIGYYNIPVIVVIFNNGTLGMVRQWQTLFFGHRYSQTTLDRGPDFMKLAEAYGLSGTRVDTVEAFAAAFKTAVEKREPCIIECMLDIDEMVAPMVAPGSPIDSFCLN